MKHENFTKNGESSALPTAIYAFFLETNGEQEALTAVAGERP
jgi:hypothetical protein